MSEKPVPEKTSPELLQKFAQDPVAALRNNHNKGCGRSINFLRSLSAEIESSGIEIRNQHPVFDLFHRSQNTNTLYWCSLAYLLKLGGFSKTEVENAFASLHETVTSSNGVVDDEARKLLLSLTSTAIVEVFDMEVSVEHLGVTEAINIAKDPIGYVSKMKRQHFTASQVIVDLHTIRRRIGSYMRATPEAVLNSVPSVFVTMYKSDDSDVAFYVALFTMLKAGGYSKDDVVDATMEKTVLPKNMQNTGTFMRLANEAIAKVYPK